MRLAQGSTNIPADPSAPGRSAKMAILVVFLGVLVAVSSLAGIYGISLAGRPASGGSLGNRSYPFTAQLSVKVYDPKGALVASETQNDDMVMNNFMNFLSSWLSFESPSGSPSTFTLTDTSGATRTLVGRDSGTTATQCTWACEYPSVTPYAGGYIAVGTSAVAPTRSDYKLGALYQSLVTVGQPTYDPSTGNIIFGVGIIAGTAASISEVGFYEDWYVGASNSWDQFLMLHDSFPAVAVTPGSTISVQYTVQLGSTAYDNNLGILLAAVMANSLGSSTSVQLTPTSGPAQIVIVYVAASPPQCCGGIGVYYINSGGSYVRADLGSGSTGADGTIRVGTGSASSCPSNSAAGFAQSRSAVNLCSPVLAYTPVDSYSVSPYVGVTAVIPSPTATSFTEAGYFLSFGSPTYTFLIMRNTFAALAVPADSSITATFEMSMS